MLEDKNIEILTALSDYFLVEILFVKTLNHSNLPLHKSLRSQTWHLTMIFIILVLSLSLDFSAFENLHFVR